MVYHLSNMATSLSVVLRPAALGQLKGRPYTQLYSTCSRLSFAPCSRPRQSFDPRSAHYRHYAPNTAQHRSSSTVTRGPPEPPRKEDVNLERGADEAPTFLGTTKRLPELNLADKVLLVSGAARGLGLVQAEALLEAGATGMLPSNPHPCSSQAQSC